MAYAKLYHKFIGLSPACRYGATIPLVMNGISGEKTTQFEPGDVRIRTQLVIKAYTLGLQKGSGHRLSHCFLKLV